MVYGIGIGIGIGIYLRIATVIGVGIGIVGLSAGVSVDAAIDFVGAGV